MKLSRKASEFISTAKKYWSVPPKGNYIPYREIKDLGIAGFGSQWVTLLATQVALSANNFLVGAAIGLEPVHLQIMLTAANIIGMPIGIFRAWHFDNHNFKGGKFLPFLRMTSFPIVILSMIFVFLPFELWNYTTKAVVVWFMYVILQFFTSYYNESFQTLRLIITPNTNERSTVMGIVQVIYSNAPSITNFLIPTVAGLTFGMNNIWTYRVIYPIFTVIGLVINTVFYSRVKERLILPKKKLEHIGIIDAMREVAKNKYFWIINVASWIGFLEGSYKVILSWSFVYANGGEKQALLGTANTILANAALWSMLAAPVLIRKIGKRNLLISCNIINVLIFISMYFMFENLLLLCVLLYVNNFVNVLSNIYLPSINGDMRDYHQWKTGVRIDGLFAPLALIGTFIELFTGLVLPFIYERMGLKEDYSVLYDDIMRNNLFEVLVICSVVGAVLNLIPYLFYDLTETKHYGYIKVLKIRTMFENFGLGELEEDELISAMEIINLSKELENKEKIAVDKNLLKKAKKLPKSTPEEKKLRNEAIEAAKREIKAAVQYNIDVETTPIVLEELNKFSTLRYRKQLERARRVFAEGEISLHEEARNDLIEAKKLPKNNKEEKEIRSDEIKSARMCLKAGSLVAKYGNITEPDERIKQEIQERETHSLAESIQARRNLRAYTKALSLYNRAVSPYVNAKNLIEQADNYSRYAEIEELYLEKKNAQA
ncbi:MAG: MFS transporter [Clostridia bacterium]|nr:MFS transporter [Clostridia bacterium]